MTKRIFLKVYCKDNRYTAINRLEEIINKHAYIVEFMPFSDIALSIVIEVAGTKLNALSHALNEYTQIQELMQIQPEQDKDYLLMLHVTFTDGTGNMKHEVPDVPG